MSRIGRLEERLTNQIEKYDKRLKQLECDHVKEPFEEYDCWDVCYYYYEKCQLCGKCFRNLSEQEYLELKLKNGKEKCTSERKELEERLAVVKEENGKG